MRVFYVDKSGNIKIGKSKPKPRFKTKPRFPESYVPDEMVTKVKRPEGA